MNRKQLLGFWPDVFGIGALWLPFIADTSPLDVVAPWSEVWDPTKALLAAPAFLAVPIAYWQAIRLLHRTTTKVEKTLAYAFSTGLQSLTQYQIISTA